ncbi:hypothetical protein ADJ73_04105 [Arsenicicoccus sp. oral taxon 190]|nr:hypothetical protein ADJ73_04105 [Arsenicicoccus sp. oral taxon 190]
MRLLRAAVLAVVVVCLAALAHLVGGGTLPGPGVLAVLVAVVGTAALVASSRRLGTWSIGAILGGGQLALHEAFALLGTTGADPASLGHVVGSGHHAVLVTHAPAGDAAAAVEHLAAHGGHHLSLPMLLAHAIATVVTTLVLARGERALWLLAGWLAPVIRVLLVRPAHRPRPTLPVLDLPRLVTADVALIAPRRGPPLVACPR